MSVDHRRRQNCTNCERPVRTCLCKLVTPIHNCVELLILQDTLETKHAKNTVSLLHLSLKNSRIYPCTTDLPMDSVQLENLLFEGNKVPILLYPLIPEANSLGLDAPVPFLHEAPLQLDRLRLIVLDATWRKSRKLVYLNRLLQRLPRFTLSNIPPSMYTIRKAKSENQLSTLEASCYALRQLEQGRVDYSPLLEAMGKFINILCEFRPARSTEDTTKENLK